MNRQLPDNAMRMVTIVMVVLAAIGVVSTAWGTQSGYEHGKRDGFREATESACWLSADLLSDLESDQCQDIAAIAALDCHLEAEAAYKAGR